MPNPTSSIEFSYSLTAADYYNKTDTNGTVYRQNADSGKMFVTIVLTAKNKGYEHFFTDPNYFSLYSTNYGVTYFTAGMSHNDVTNWPTVDVPNGGAFTGTMLLQLPKDALSLTPGYQNYNIPYHTVWIRNYDIPFY
jgi:hypothetical protein